jgi:large subunit ribosomal protein L25
MKVVAFSRKEQGTGASRRLRNANTTPGIVYGGGKPATPIKIDHNPLFHALNRATFHSTIHDLEIDGVVEPVVLRDFQMHAFKPLVMHIDFQRVVPEEKITIRVPVNFINLYDCIAAKTGGSSVKMEAQNVGINCLPKDLPTAIDIDLMNLAPGQEIVLGDVALPNGVTVTDNPKTKMASASAVK